MTRSRSNRGSSTAARDLQRQQLLFWKWRDLITKLMINRINWSGLPETVDERFLETVLATQGKAVFYEEAGNLLATRVVIQDKPDVNENYSKFQSIGPGWTRDIPENEGILVWNSTNRSNNWTVFDEFASDLAELDILGRTNRSQQRWAKLLLADEANYNDVKRIVEDLDRGKPLTVGLTSLGKGIEAIALDLSTPYMQEDFHADKEAVLAELYLFLGLRSVSREKPAYMNYSETDSGNDAVARVREDLLLPRSQAAEAMNEKWGLDITVSWRDEQLNAMTDTNPSGAENDTDRN